MFFNKLSVTHLILLCIASLLIFVTIATLFNKQSDSQNNIKKPASGARMSLDYISLVRSYPEADIPDAGFSAAFHAAKTRLKSSSAAIEWTSLGPVNIAGRMLSIAINHENPSIVFAGSASGGLWKSTSGGSGDNAWEYVYTGFPVLGVAAIAIDPQNAQAMFIGTGESYGTDTNMPGVGPTRVTRGSYGIGILKSTDGGETWEKSLDWSLNQKRAVQKIAINPLRSNSVWAATTEGTYVSYNGGESWTLKHGISMATDILINPNDTTVMYFAFGGMQSEGHGIYRSTDAGSTLQAVDLVAAGGPDFVAGKIQLDMSGSDPDIVMASIGVTNGILGGLEGHIPPETYLMKTVDGGENWFTASTLNYSRIQGWYSHAVAIHPEDPDKVWTGGQLMTPYYSDDGGFNLESTDSLGMAQPALTPDNPSEYPYEDYPYQHAWADYHDIIFHPSNSDIIYFVNDGGVFRTTDGGFIFENCNSGLQTTQFYNGVSVSNVNSNLMIGGLQDNASVIYEGSPNWRRIGLGDGGWAAINQSDNNTMYATAQFAYIIRSSNKFIDLEYDVLQPSDITVRNLNFICPVVLSPADNQTIYVGTEWIHKSSNEGNDWSRTNGGVSLDGNAMSVLAASHQDVNVVYAASSPEVATASVYRTTDGGENWFNITGNLPNLFPTDLFVNPNDDEHVFITYGGFGADHVYMTKNGGDTWVNITSNLPDVPTWAVTMDPENPDHIFIGNEIGIFRSINSGDNWEFINGNLPDAVFAIELVISSSDRKLRVVTHGNGVFETPLGEMVSIEETEKNENVNEITLHQNYPNPFNPYTQISYSLNQSTHVRLQIFDINGRLIETLVDNNQSAGVHSINFDGSHLSSGTYFYKLEAGSKVQTKKMTLLK